MEDEEEQLVKWDNRFGPASILAVIQIIVVIAAVVLAFGSVRDAVENSKVAVTKLESIITALQAASHVSAERITRVEERTDAVAKSLDRIERKVDQLPQKK